MIGTLWVSDVAPRRDGDKGHNRMHGPPVLADVVIGPHGLLTGWMFDIVARLAAHVLAVEYTGQTVSTTSISWPNRAPFASQTTRVNP